MSSAHPFYSGTYNGRDCYCMTADDRVKRVADFDLPTCRPAEPPSRLPACRAQ